MQDYVLLFIICLLYLLLAMILIQLPVSSGW